MTTRSLSEAPPRFSPRSPGARLQSLRRALWEEDRAVEWFNAVRRVITTIDDLRETGDAFRAARQARMEAEREMWEAMPGHRLD